MSNEEEKCAPIKSYNEGSCFTKDQLKKMSESYNNFIDDNKIKGKKINIVDNKRELIKQLTVRLENRCKDQICWLKQKFVKILNDDDIFNNTFRPVGPNGKFEWLSTTHINDVMGQYEYKYPEFKFFGAVPIDFDKLPFLGIKDVNYDDLYKTKTKLGFVFNLDEHWQSGSHWVSLYTDLEKKQIYFFDSYGKRPEKRIRDLVKKLSRWCHNKHNCNNICSITDGSESYMRNKNKNNIEQKLNIEYNRNRHQYKNSECGVYSLNFILRLLNGNSFNQITKTKVLDDEINDCRNVYFRFSK